MAVTPAAPCALGPNQPETGTVSGQTRALCQSGEAQSRKFRLQRNKSDGGRGATPAAVRNKASLGPSALAQLGASPTLRGGLRARQERGGSVLWPEAPEPRQPLPSTHHGASSGGREERTLSRPRRGFPRSGFMLTCVRDSSGAHCRAARFRTPAPAASSQSRSRKPGRSASTVVTAAPRRRGQLPRSGTRSVARWWRAWRPALKPPAPG